MKNKIFPVILIFTLIICMNVSVYAAVEIPENIRIGLYYGATAAKSVELKSEAGLTVGTLNDDVFTPIEEIAPNKTITIKKGSSNETLNVSGIGDIGDDDNVVSIIPNENEEGIKLISVNDKIYRGSIEVKRFPTSDMTVINLVSMQEYLYGVVPREIGGNSPIEAVKAQAIIARTYATKNYNRREKWGYNLNPTVDDQAYGGYAWENPNSNKAVDDTYGMIAVYDEKPIGGYYFSTSGGYTENCANVWGGSFDYLQAVPDPFEPTDLKMTTWSVTLTDDEVKEKLANIGVNVGNIKNIIPTEFSDVGRVTELKIVGTNGTEVLSKEKVRTAFGLYSQWYTVNSEAPKAVEINIEDYMKKDDTEVVVEEEEKEEKPLLKMIKDIFREKSYEEQLEEIEEKQINYSALTADGIFLFQGRGWGHAVGMSQNGAIGMAKNGFTYDEIIKWYYVDTEIINS